MWSGRPPTRARVIVRAVVMAAVAAALFAGVALTIARANGDPFATIEISFPKGPATGPAWLPIAVAVLLSVGWSWLTVLVALRGWERVKYPEERG